MKFEFDKKKSETNRLKHGMDFVEAQALWCDENRIVFPAKSDDEARFALISIYDSKHWVAFYTLRGANIRLISIRRARETEKELYEG